MYKSTVFSTYHSGGDFNLAYIKGLIIRIRTKGKSKIFMVSISSAIVHFRSGHSFLSRGCCRSNALQNLHLIGTGGSTGKMTSYSFLHPPWPLTPSSSSPSS